MKTRAERHLEAAALDCHARGVGWSEYWRNHGAAVARAEPHNRQRFGRLVCRLLSLVASGDTANVEPLDAPWEADGYPEPAGPSAAGTAARINWQANGIAAPEAAR